MLHDTANIVIKRTEVRAVGGHRSGEMKSSDVFDVHFNAYFACSAFAGSAETDAG